MIRPTIPVRVGHARERKCCTRRRDSEKPASHARATGEGSVPVADVARATPGMLVMRLSGRSEAAGAFESQTDGRSARCEGTARPRGTKRRETNSARFNSKQYVEMGRPKRGNRPALGKTRRNDRAAILFDGNDERSARSRQESTPQASPPLHLQESPHSSGDSPFAAPVVPRPRESPPERAGFLPGNAPGAAASPRSTAPPRSPLVEIRVLD